MNDEDKTKEQLIQELARLRQRIAELECQETERKHAEEETLRASEDNFRNSLNDSPLGIRIVTADGDTLYTNQALLDIYGYASIEEFRTTQRKERYTPESYAQHQIRKEKRQRGECVPSYYEISIVRKNGEIRYLQTFRKEVLWNGKSQFQVLYHDATEIKQMEEALNKSVKLLNDTGKMAKVGGWELDLSTKEVSWTEEVGRIHAVKPGYKPTLKEALDFYDPESRPDVEAVVKRAAETGEPYVLESLLVPRGNKDKIWVRSIGKAIYSDGKIVKLAGTLQDITEHKRLEEGLRQSEEKHRTLFETMAQGVVYQDAEGHIISANPTAERILGLTLDQMMGRASTDPRWKAIHEDGSDFPGDTHPAMVALRTGKEVRNVIMGVFRPGENEYVWINIIAIPQFKQGNTKPYQVYTTFEDITEHKQMEEVLKNSEKKYRELTDFLPQTVFELDKGGNIIFANPHGFQSSGYTPEDIKKGLNALQLFIPEDRVRVKKNIRMALGGRKSKANEYTALRKHGSTYPVIVYSAPVIDEGKPVGLRGVVVDITERKRMENELQNSREQLRSLTAHLQSVREEERTDIARGIHDDLGQALTALKMDLSWLSKRLPKEQESLLEKTEVMSGLIDSAVQTVKKISTELRPGILDDFGLIAAIEWQTEEFQKRSGIKCTVSSMTEPHLDGEHTTALFRIFQETLTNVARHTSATRVTVNLKCQGGKMIMRIRDNGKGITQEQISSSSSFGIIGMRERVRALRGDIGIRGIPGKGTTVTVTIPLVKNGEAQ